MHVLVARPPGAPATSRLQPHALVLALVGGLGLAALGRPAGPGWLLLLVAVPAAVARPGRTAVGGLAALLCAAGWIWGAGRMQQTAPVRLALPMSVDGTGVVDAPPRRRALGGWRVTVRAGAPAPGRQGPPEGVRLIVWLSGPPPPVGAIVALRGRVRDAAGPRAPGWWRRYLERQRVSGAMGAARLPVLGRRGGLPGIRDRASAWLRRQIGARLPGDAGALVQGLALGGSQGLDARTEEEVREAGMSHLLAVSGQNVAVVAVAVGLALRRAGINRLRSLLVLAVLVAGYCLVCEPGASVGRAGAVALLGIVGEALSRGRDRWHLLLVALAALLAWQPRSLWDPGLQLSFAAVIGILAIGSPLCRWACAVMPRRLGELTGIAGAAGLATAPVVVVDFGRLSLAGFLTNIVAVPLASVVLVTALAGAVLAAVPGPLADLVIPVAGAGARIILALARLAAATPGASVGVPAVAAPLAAAPAAGVWLAADGRWRRVRGVIGGRPER